MKIRTQLIVAFLLLAIVPLAGIVLYSYASSSKAVKRAAVDEAEALSAEMEARLDRVRRTLHQRMANLPFRGVVSTDSEVDEAQVIADLEAQLGDVAAMVESLAFVPAPAEPPQPPARHAQGRQGPGRGTSGPGPPGFRQGVPSSRLDSIRNEPPALPPSVSEVDPEMIRLRIETTEELERFIRRRSENVADSTGTTLHGVSEAELGRMLQWTEEIEGSPDPDPDVEAEPEIAAPRVEMQERWLELGHRAPRRHTLPGEPMPSEMVLGKNLEIVPIRENGKIIGMIRPRINPETVLEMVFASTPRDRGEIPFAVDTEGRVFTADDKDRRELDEELGLDLLSGFTTAESTAQGELEPAPGQHGEPAADPSSAQAPDLDNPRLMTAGFWVVATSVDEASGLRFGIARPFGDSLRQLQATSVRNFVFGVLMILLATLGILPVTHRLALGLRQVTAAAQKVAQGDLGVRVEPRGTGEVAQLANAFNSMAHDLQDQRQRLIAEERRRRNQEVERRVMQAELERRGRELEEARQFQISLLPTRMPEHPTFDLAVRMRTAAEVGGDYYDYCLEAGGRLTLAIGDATGHGARAGTMVTVIKSLFTGCTFEEVEPAEFLAEAHQTVERMRLGRMAMALQLLELDGHRLRLTNAGMPPVLLHRGASNQVQELLVQGSPLGSLGNDYQTLELPVEAGDTLLLLSDGVIEQPGADGDPVGYDRVARTFAETLARARQEPGSTAQVLDRTLCGLEALVDELTGGHAPDDDVTLLLVHVRA